MNNKIGNVNSATEFRDNVKMVVSLNNKVLGYKLLNSIF